MKQLCWLLVAACCVLPVSAMVGSTCLQEFANVSVNCGGVALPGNGSYANTSGWKATHNASSSFDGSYSTYALYEVGEPHVNETYYLAPGVDVVNSRIQSKITNVHAIANYSQSLCWNGGRVLLQSNSNNVFDTEASVQCLNSAGGWSVLANFTDDFDNRIYENALYVGLHYNISYVNYSFYDSVVGYNGGREILLFVQNDSSLVSFSGVVTVGGVVYPLTSLGSGYYRTDAIFGLNFTGVNFNTSFNVTFNDGSLNGSGSGLIGESTRANTYWNFTESISGNRLYPVCDITSGYFFVNTSVSNYSVIEIGGGVVTTDIYCYSEGDIFPPFNTTITINKSASASNYFNITIPGYLFNVSFFDAGNGSSITWVNVTATLSNDVWSRSNVSQSGSGVFTNLTSGVYNVVVSAPSYSSQSYVVTFGSSASVNLSAYLLNTTVSNVVLTVVDQDNNGQVLAGAGVVQYGFVNGSLTAVANCLSDVTGKCQFSFYAGQKYVFVTSKSGYDSYTFTLNPILFTAYDVPLSRTLSDTQGYGDVTVYMQPSVFWNNESNNFTIVFASGAGTLVTYNFSIVYPGGSSGGVGSTASGESFNHVFTMVGATLSDAVVVNFTYRDAYGYGSTQSRVFGISGRWGNHTLVQLMDNHYGMSLFERILIVTIIGIICGGLVTAAAGSLVGVVFALLIYGVFAALGFIPAYVVVGVIIVGFFIVSRRSGEGYG